MPLGTGLRPDGAAVADDQKPAPLTKPSPPQYSARTVKVGGGAAGLLQKRRGLGAGAVTVALQPGAVQHPRHRKGHGADDQREQGI